MNRPGVVVVNADRQEGQAVAGLLSGEDYGVTPLHGLVVLEKHLQDHPAKVVIIDLDTVRPDNEYFRSFKKRYPDICILATSSRPYHPRLEEAIRLYIYACLGKPLDREELLYWLKSISESSSSSLDEGRKDS